ncbi:hypothetical protein GCM10010124_34070 [Pilimelia terevasa]|uniref:Cobalamin biosynthesis protein CobD n=1 Tax=Pilimelia terevasa TaxID=53372 RepID=A0A8J3FLU4_9ACTN|nr:cobalamin biosynthesis protein [Pilimelia terevasa]GGK38405.1 hypothetical protein GCM10010124_34070 [Pilimelia terevasa]
MTREYRPSSPWAAFVAQAGGLVAGFALDAAYGDPRRGHPVAGFGRFAAFLERATYRPGRGAGAVFAGLAVAAPVLVGVAVQRATRRRPVLRGVAVAAGTWAVLGGRTLRREATVMADALDAGDLDRARARLGHLCGRDPAALDAAGLARATVESVAENTSDAVVAPLCWGAVAGLPGLLGYRAVNTLDAMVGHRSPRYARFGTPAARLDDLANLAASRLTGLLIVAVAPLAGADRAQAWRVFRRDRADHPSPNAGQCEAAMAGALGVRLGGRNAYAGRTETRPLLGDGPAPGADAARRAARLSGLVGLAGVLCAVAAVGAGGALARILGRRGRPAGVGPPDRTGGRAAPPEEVPASRRRAVAAGRQR